jgi:drug/metabolite transporter (DMT)-like permease
MSSSSSLTTSRPLGALALLLATGSWGGLFLASRPVLADLDPAWFTFVRYSIASLVFVVLLSLRGAAPWRRLRAHAGGLALRGLAGFGVFGVLLLSGLAHSLPTHGAVIMATVPMSTQLLRWLLDGQRPGRVTVFSSLLALVGVLVVSGVLHGDGAQASTAFGDLLMLIATLGWVWYTRGTAVFADFDALEYTGLTILAVWPLLLLLALAGSVSGLGHWPEAARVWAWWPQLLYVGLAASAAGILLYNHGVRTLGSVTATAFTNFVPVSALLISLALGKTPTGAELLGMGLVIAALLMHVQSQRATAAAATSTAAAITPHAMRLPQNPQNGLCSAHGNAR